MLERLFGSQTRVKILKLFLLHPDQTYYIRQVARDLELQVNSARRELDNLEKFGILGSGSAPKKIENGEEGQEKKEEGKNPARGKSQEKKYYYVNKNFVLYEEMRALLVKSQVLYREDFIESLKQLPGVQLIVLTGLFVNKPDGMIDLFLVGDVDKNKLKKVIDKLEEEMGRELNYTVMDYDEYKYRSDITDVFLYNILEQKKIIVVDEVGLS
ncbi:MAG: hypothetical protein ACOCVY_02225 [Patescibacteria group bacterium]